MPARKKSAVEVQKELGQSRTLASYKPTSSGDPPVPEFLQHTDLSYFTQPANRPTTQYKSPIDCSIQNNPMNAAFTGETDDEAVNALGWVSSLVNRAFDRSFDESTLVQKIIDVETGETEMRKTEKAKKALKRVWMIIKDS